MLNDAHVSITGYVVSQPKGRRLPNGVPILTMRIGWTPRRLDRSTGEWVDGNTSYASVICWRRLAMHASVCLRKGDPVNVIGRLSVRDYEVEGVQRTAVEVEASSIGHDLNRGVASFSRVRPQTGQTAAEYEEAMAAGNGQSGPRPPTGLGKPAGIDPADRLAGEAVPGEAVDPELAPPGYGADDVAGQLIDADGSLGLAGLAESGNAGAEDDPDEVPDQVPAPF